MSSGPGFALGTITPSGWQAQQIVYCHLTASTLQYSYLYDSGLVTSNININSFIQSVVAGDPTVSTPLPGGQTPPDLVVTVPCYVVVALDSTLSWAFQPGVAPILTEQNLASKYCALNIVDSGGNIYAGQTPTSPTSPPCLIAYFSVVSVAPASEDVADPFSYFLQVTQQGGNTYNVVVDPEIRNEGPGG